VKCVGVTLEFLDMTTVWHSTEQPGLGFLGTLSTIIARAEDSNPGLIPDLRRNDALVVASDYGGEHRAAQWASYSYLITDRDAVAQWAPLVRSLRKQLLPDGRRLAFKHLGDRIRMRALGPFLSVANDLRGLSASFLVHHQVASLFGSARLDPASLSYEPLRAYPSQIVEKLLRVTHFLALLIAGTSAHGQDLLWITDEDAIAPNMPGLHVLTDVIGRATASLLDHDMRHLRVATARSDPGDQSVEDLLALPDLVAGVLPAHLAELLGDHGAPPAGFFLPRPDRVPPKQRVLLDWFSDNTQSLKRLVILVDRTETGALRGTRLRYHGTRDVENG